MSKPTLHITNWSSKKLHGTGKKWTIMARPRQWENGDGNIFRLTPWPEDLDALKTEKCSLAEYKNRYDEKVFGTHATADMLEPIWSKDLSPGFLRADVGNFSVVVQDNDTICCGCSREASLSGLCHRAWAASYLLEAGWNIVLEGIQLSSLEKVEV